MADDFETEHKLQIRSEKKSTRQPLTLFLPGDTRAVNQPKGGAAAEPRAGRARTLYTLYEQKA